MTMYGFHRAFTAENIAETADTIESTRQSEMEMNNVASCITGHSTVNPIRDRGGSVDPPPVCFC